MSGKVLLDTNVIIDGLKHGWRFPEGEYLVSVITEMELLSFPRIREEQEVTIRRLLSNFRTIGLNIEVKEEAIRIRRTYGLKLPDSIICASAKVEEAMLWSRDRQLRQVEGIEVEEPVF